MNRKGLFKYSSNGEAETVVQNNPSSLIVLIPTLRQGTCQIKIITQYNGGKDLKEPRTTVYNKTLEVR
ncbi:MAG: DUF4469 domain-containing protein [Bacteroidales bacterium]|jgi:hypothetical protein|nr:DUF4469 domain-containing protein [Bacteroidales bacterium]